MISKILQCISPIDESIYATRKTLEPDEAKAAIAQARKAQKTWSQKPLSERIDLVRRGVAKVGETTERMALELAHHMGRPVRYGGEFGGFMPSPTQSRITLRTVKHMTITANWSYPTAIRFGAGRISEIADACKSAGISNPLLVTDKGLASMDITTGVLDLMKSCGLGSAIFCDVDPNPNEKNVEAGLIAYRQGKHDGVIAFGGGSGLDLGKVLAFMAGQKRPLWDFEDIGDWWTRADSDSIDPIVAVPTTAGTGSEVGRASVITNSVTAEKKIIFHPKILPSVVICDPELTVGMPKFITAGTGMDAFAHCLEAYCSPHYHPMSQGMALEGMRLVKEYLLRAFSDGNDIEARAHMMSAAAMGATAFQKGLGAIHALSHPIGAIHHTHHGTTNAVVMQEVLKFNRPAIEGTLTQAANYLDIEGGFDGFYDFVGNLNKALGIPKSLTELGVENPDIERLLKDALADPSTAGNPVEMTQENTRALLNSCF